ncbi:MAG: pteridine-dependent deoxygenase [Rhodanobacteraceae bacterium]
MDDVGNLPLLRFDYEPSGVTDVVEPGVLAVLEFGNAARAQADPRWLRVRLEPLAAPPVQEVWRTHAPVRCGYAGDIRWSHDGDYCFFAIEVEESSRGGIAGAAERAYREICGFLAASGTPHLLRLWNYMDAINLGDGDSERYRQFCSGRARGLANRSDDSYPAATAIGRRDGVRVLQVYGLAARLAGTPIENPRQVSAWRYPRQYGASPPAFARAMRSPANQLLISGTAAVVGHASTHRDDLAAQLDETATNLSSLLCSAGCTQRVGASSLLKAYVRQPQHAAEVIAALRAMIPRVTGVLLLAGDICRTELLVEVDGVHG